MLPAERSLLKLVLDILFLQFSTEIKEYMGRDIQFFYSRCQVQNRNETVFEAKWRNSYVLNYRYILCERII